MLSRIRCSYLLRTSHIGVQFITKQCPSNKTHIRFPKQVLSRLSYSTDNTEDELECDAQHPSSDRSMKKFLNAEPISGFANADISTSGAWNEVTSVKYEQFDTSGTRIIYDITEEELGLVEEAQPKAPPPIKETLDIKLTRGKHGVYDLEDLVEVLKMENAKDLVALKIPEKLNFVDHMVLVTATSQRHLNAIALTVRKIYIKKMSKKDRSLILEGRFTTWVAMDLGNIALHIMSPVERKRVDIESLWACGAEHDTKILEAAEEEEDDIFSLADKEEEDKIEYKVFDITKLYDHPYHPVSETEVLPDIDDIVDEDYKKMNYAATSFIEMELRKHNGKLAKKYRGRFKK